MNLSENFKIAVITPVFNAESTIKNSLNSLLNQSFKNWINILINDGSTDNTLTILNHYKSKDCRFHIVSYNTNRGRGYARKTGLQIVSEMGIPYLCMLDADDIYYPDKLLWQYEFMQKNPDVCLLSSSMGIINNQMDLISISERFPKFSEMLFGDYENYLGVPHASSIIRAKCIGHVTFDENMHYAQDQDFMIRILKGKKYVYVPKISYLYNRGDSFSFEKYKKSIQYNLKTYEKLSVSKWFLFKTRFFNQFKIFVLFVLIKLRLQKLYFNGQTRRPSADEMTDHSNFLRSFKEIGSY